ncbi:MAG: DUF2927 domain-containing protein [Rhodobacteraceae bacterium]|nr:DUF2927 domain-containing protein [Paracoccaceae bacterium]
MACEMPATVAPLPPAAPAAAPAPRPRAPAAPTGASAEVARHFAGVESRLLAQGLLRTDGGGRDTPFDARILAETFVEIALRDEYTVEGGRLVARPAAAALRRWQTGVRIGVTHGAASDATRRARDRIDVAAFAARLARVTRHPIALAATGANFHVLYLTEDERRAAGPELRALVPGIDALSVQTITDMPLTTFCLVLAFSRGGQSSYHAAVAVVRAELPDLLRVSCLQEELAQGLGLANDSPRARPSIFNDDEEFAFLTRMDELLLRILYDPRLGPGMTEPVALPIVHLIAQGILGGTG